MSILPEHSSKEEQQKWIEDERDEFAELRSHDASKISYDFQKVTAQSCLLINGGAATAVLALLAKDKVDPSLLKTVPWCLALYATGVAASPAAVDVRYRRVLRCVAFIATMRCLPGKDGRGSQNTIRTATSARILFSLYYCDAA
jgi:hypothetical protein